MSLLGKVKIMFGFAPRNQHTPDPIKVDMSRALQRNERASQRAQEALESLLNRNDRVMGARGDV